MALGYREMAAKFSEKNIILFGVNDGSLESADAWVQEEQLPFTVLNDSNRFLGTEMGMSSVDGDRYITNASEGRRPAVVVDEHGVICAWEPDMNDVTQITDLLGRL